MWRAVLIGISLIVSACVPSQPESYRTVAAFEVPLLTPSDRNEFLALLRQEAGAEGLHVDARSDDQLKQAAAAIPQAERTIHAAVWRGRADDRLEASIMDGHDHLGRVWITFLQGDDIAVATRFRERVMSRIVLRWPETRSLPVMPTGSIPNPYQLVRTSSGYKLDRAHVSSYDVVASSPLVFQPEAD